MDLKRKLPLLSLFIVLFGLAGAQTPSTVCIVDQCMTCNDKTTNTCVACKTGYYLKTYTGQERGDTYNDCWSTFKFWLYLIIGILCLIALIGLFIASFYLGKSGFNLMGKKVYQSS